MGASIVTEDEFNGKKPPCDLVMKGGGVSDVAYPTVIVELAKKYRFSSVGGTSAGALAAAIAAAGEYARETNGFQRIAEIPNEVADTLFSQFQPEPQLRPLFNMLTAPLGSGSALAKWIAVISSAVMGYPRATLIGLVPALLVLVFTFDSQDYGWLAFAVLLGLVGVALSLGLRLKWALTKEMPEANFGLCSGKTMPGARGPGVTDWLADTIDRVAGNVDERGRPDRPLTFGDLKKRNPSFELAMITTDLGMMRPYKVPFREAEPGPDGAPQAVEPHESHFFSKADFEKLFPPRVMAQMCRNEPLIPEPHWSDCPGDLCAFPKERDLPIVVAARMSLSVPFILQAIPVYKRDLTLQQGADQPRKCWFTDGGVSNNFPIHFFDRLWPNAPTFAISFDEFAEERHLEGKEERRVEMATDLREGDILPILPISGIGAFALRMVDTARSWQDNLQRVLPGYRERIVHIHLKPDEGGYNLKMPPNVILRLAEFGKEAGALAASDDFNMDEHRWRRFLIAMAEMEQLLDELATSHDKRPPGCESFDEFLERYKSAARYQPTNEDSQLDPGWKTETLKRARALVSLGNQWREKPTVRSGRIPKPECDFRISPKQ